MNGEYVGFEQSVPNFGRDLGGLVRFPRFRGRGNPSASDLLLAEHVGYSQKRHIGLEQLLYLDEAETGQFPHGVEMGG